MQTARKISANAALEFEVSERIRLVGAIWESIAEVPETVKLTGEQQVELDRRLAAYRAGPHTGSPWSEVKAHSPGTAKMMLRFPIPEMDRFERLVDYGEQWARAVCGRGIDWDGLTAAQHEELVDQVLNGPTHAAKVRHG